MKHLIFISIILLVVSCHKPQKPGLSIKSSVTDISDSTAQISVLAQTFEDDELRDIHVQIKGSDFAMPYHPDNFQALHNLHVQGGKYSFDFV